MRVMAVAAICLQEDHIMYEIVNIERAFACGGNEIAKKLAADLGYTYHGHDVLEEAANQLGISISFYLSDRSN